MKRANFVANALPEGLELSCYADIVVAQVKKPTTQEQNIHIRPQK
jgi:hypothetical protein